MGLFTNPVVLNNGVARSFEPSYQSATKKERVSEYIETAATITEASILAAKYDVANKILRRGLLHRSRQVANSAGILKPITWNLTFIADPLHAAADIENEGKLLGAAMAAVNFYVNFVKRLS